MASQGKKIAEEMAPVERKFPTRRKTVRRPASRRARAKKSRPALTIWEKLAAWAGKCEGLPSDLAERHDFYLHGRSDV